MKKWISLVLCFAFLFTFAGCGDSALSAGTRKQPTGVSDVLEAMTADEDSKKDDTGSQASETTSGNADERQSGVNADAPKPEPIIESEITEGNTEGIDIDLTVLSGTMVYAEVYNMMAAPKSYIGKTVKMEGSFAAYHDEVSDNYYFACIIMDATACCSQGMEFVLTDDYTYPDDYPEEGEDICVIGVFDLYNEDGLTYCTLRNAKIV